MPKITVHGGASNALDGSGDPADRKRRRGEETTVELSRSEEHPNAPMERPGEGRFFLDHTEGTEGTEGEDQQPEVAKVPAKRAGAKRTGGTV